MYEHDSQANWQKYPQTGWNAVKINQSIHLQGKATFFLDQSLVEHVIPESKSKLFHDLYANVLFFGNRNQLTTISQSTQEFY